MLQRFKSQKLRSLWPYFVLAVAVIATYKAVNELSFFLGIIKRIWSIILPFFYGFMLAYIVNIPSNGIQKLLNKSHITFIQKRKKALSLVIVLLIAALILFLVLSLVAPSVYESLSLFVANFQAYYEGTQKSILEFIDRVNEMDIFGLYISPDTITQAFQKLFGGFGVENLTSSIQALLGVSSAIFSGFLAFVSSIYILLEKEKIGQFFSRLLKAFMSAGAYSVTMEYVGRLNQNFKRYIKTQTIDGCILGAIVTIELTILRSPYALILGIMLGFVNYIPYFGSIIGSFIAVIIVGFTQGISTAVITAVVLLITQQIDGNVIQPRLMGGTFSLSPLLVIISITIGGAFAGILGMIAAIPIVAVLKDMLDGIIAYYERHKAEKDGEQYDNPFQ